MRRVLVVSMMVLLLLSSCQSSYSYYDDYQIRRNSVSTDGTTLVNPIVGCDTFSNSVARSSITDHLVIGKFYFTDFQWNAGSFTCVLNSSYTGVLEDFSCTFTLLKDGKIVDSVVWVSGVVDLAYQHLIVQDSHEFDGVQVSNLDYVISEVNIDYYDTFESIDEISVVRTGTGVYQYKERFLSGDYRLILVNDKMQVFYNELLTESCIIVVKDSISRIGVIKGD